LKAAASLGAPRTETVGALGRRAREATGRFRERGRRRTSGPDALRLMVHQVLLQSSLCESALFSARAGSDARKAPLTARKGCGTAIDDSGPTFVSRPPNSG